jgi:hypothetical protein
MQKAAVASEFIDNVMPFQPQGDVNHSKHVVAGIIRGEWYHQLSARVFPAQ